jgi:hypothetical protein
MTIDKCAGQMMNLMKISIWSTLTIQQMQRQCAFVLPTFERSFWTSLILLHRNSLGGDQIFKMTDEGKWVRLLASGHPKSRFNPKQINSHFFFRRVTALSSLKSAVTWMNR